MRRRMVLGAMALVLVAVGSGVATTATAQIPPVSLLGFSNLGGQGANGSVAVVGNTAVVGAGFLPNSAAHTGFYNPITCPFVSVKVVDLTNPASPTVASTIPVPFGQVALDVDALHVATPNFTGDLAAVAFTACSVAGFSSPAGVGFYNITNRGAPALLGRIFPDDDFHEVALAQRPDGRVLALATVPFNGGDVIVIDATNPASPVDVSQFPASGAPATFSNNGCRPFNAGHSAEPSADGNQMLVPYLDAGLFSASLADPANPSTFGRYAYPPDRAVEGQAGYAAYAGSSRPLALVSEEDWVAPNSTVVISAPGAAGGLKQACEAIFNLFDPQNDSAVYRRPNQNVTGEIVYAGRGCPQSGGAAPDPYLSSAAGKIVLVDRSAQAAYPGGVTPGNFCSFADRVRVAQQQGAIGVLLANNSTLPPFSPDGDPPGISIPMYMIEKVDADALRPLLCPSVASGQCTAHRAVYASMVDRPGSWGALRVVDLSNPASPTLAGSYQTPRSRIFPPPDLGVYAPARAAAKGDYGYVAWNSDGLRVLDLSTPSNPVELGSFVPADTVDPKGAIPNKTYVQGVDNFGCGKVVISDINSGLYVLNVPAPPNCAALSAPAARPGPASAPASAQPAAKPGTTVTEIDTTH